MSFSVTVIGASVLVLLLAGYFGQKYLPPPKPKIVGIDLGTTFSCIAVFYPVTGHVEVIPDDKGRRTVPSIVAFRSKSQHLVGHDAMEYGNYQPNHVFYDSKRFIGQNFDSLSLAKEAGRYPFRISLNGTKPLFHVAAYDDVEEFSVQPETISSLILVHLKNMALQYLGIRRLVGAVISVPAEFDEQRRNATIHAANLADIDVLRLINEPTAAALAYGLHRKKNVSSIVVFDLGGGTLDVSVLMIMGGMFLTQAVAGNNHLGGQDFNHNLMKHLQLVAKNRYGQMLSHDDDVHAMYMAVESAKLALTQELATTIRVPLTGLNEDNEKAIFEYTITRQMFEQLNRRLYERALKPIRVALEDADMSIDDVDEVVMVGGSTRMPKIRQVVSAFFNNKALNCDIDPELAVAIGVGIQAGVLAQAWPIQVSATEIATKYKKIHVYDDDDED